MFDDFDGGAIVTGFTFSADLRTGGGTTDPADGYSVSFVRAGDPVLTAADAGSGFAGPPEEGTTTGISVGLDEWASGTLPAPDNVTDVIGVSVRVDGVLVNQTALPTKNGSAADTTSLQTGPAGVPLDFDFSVPGHSFVNLTIKVDPDGTLDVSYKGVPILDNFATSYFPSAGRIVLAGRTGDANSHHHVDNIAITTIAATVPLIDNASITPDRFNAVVLDSATALVDITKPFSVTVDGTAIAATATKTGNATTFAFTQTPPALFAAGNHAIVINLRDTNNNAYVLNRSAVTPTYFSLDAAWKAAPGQVSTTTPSYLSTVHQLEFARGPGDANVLPNPERQLANGYYDQNIPGIAANVIDTLALPPAGVTQQPNGEYVLEGVLNWDELAGAQGNFTSANGFPETTIPGIPGTTGTTDNIVAEFFTWIDLPAGATNLGFNSDDGFTVSFGATALDFFNRQVAGQFNGGRGAADTTFYVTAPSAGLYPVRVLWWEGGGGANLEFFSVLADGTKVLINDATNPNSLKAYYAGLPAKPSIHLIAPYPSTAVESNRNHPIQIDLVDGVASVTDASIVLTVDGTVVTPTVTNAGLRTRISLAPTGAGGAWTSGNHTVQLAYNDSASTPRTQTWSFNTAGLTYYWSGLGDQGNLLDPANWRDAIVPPNDGLSINLPASERIGFDGAALTIPDVPGQEINLAPGAQIVKDPSNGRTYVNARINASGTGPAGNGFFYVQGGDWGLPNNIVLNGNGSTRADGDRLRIDGGANRLDLGTFTLTMSGTSENNMVNTNVLGEPGAKIISNNLFSMEAGTRFDPNITLEMAPGVLFTSWGGQGAVRAAPVTLKNNAIIETRHDDDDLTFTAAITVGAGDTGILKGRRDAGDNGNDDDLRLNITGPLTGAGIFRQEEAGTLILSGNSTATGGLSLAGTGTTVIGNNSAAGTGPITMVTSTTLAFTNGGGQEYIDSDSVESPLDDANKTRIDPVISGIHSRQYYGDNRRISYTGLFNNPGPADKLYTFGAQYDDDTYLEIDGNVLIQDNTWAVVNTAQITLSPGPHEFRISGRNGGGGGGPNNGENDAFLGWNQFGLGVSTTLPDDGNGGIDADKTAVNYTKVGRYYEVYQPEDRSIANAIVLTSSGSLSTANMNGYDATVGGGISGPGGLTVVGSALYNTDELILTGAGTYAGPTTVTGGSLVVNGNFSAATGAVSVGAASTLGGTGTVGGVTTVSGGIAPGGANSSVGTLSIGANTTWNGGASWRYQLGAPGTGDQLAITGDFLKGTGTAFSFDFEGTGAPGSYTLVTWTGSTTFAATDFTGSNLTAGSVTGTFSIVGKTLVLNVPTSPYLTWASTAFAAGTSSADKALGADPDDDGVTNLMEYALNTNPSAFSTTPPTEVVVVGADSFLQLRWTRPNDRTDITTIGQVSLDLTPSTNWLTGAANVTTTISPAGAGQEEVVIRDVQPIGGVARRFLRAKVTLP